MRKRYSVAHYERVYSIAVEMRERGYLLADIAEEISIPVSTVQKWLSNGRKNAPTAEFTPGQLTRAWEMLNTGQPYRDVAQYLKVSDHTVARYFPNMGWTREEAADYGRYIKEEMLGLEQYL